VGPPAAACPPPAAGCWARPLPRPRLRPAPLPCPLAPWIASMAGSSTSCSTATVATMSCWCCAWWAQIWSALALRTLLSDMSASDSSTLNSLGSFCRKWQLKKVEFSSPLGQIRIISASNSDGFCFPNGGNAKSFSTLWMSVSWWAVRSRALSRVKRILRKRARFDQVGDKNDRGLR
jgi:hypothetical protein